MAQITATTDHPNAVTLLTYSTSRTATTPINTRSNGMPVRMFLEKNHQCGCRSSATVSPSLIRWRGYGTCREYVALRDGPEHAIEVRVAEDAVRIEPRPACLEACPLRIARRERLGALIVHLAPVRSAADVVHDRFDTMEVPIERPAGREVHRQVAGLAALGGAERDVVGGGHAQLDREVDREPLPLDEVPHPQQRLAELGPRDRVLHLHEAHEPGAAQHAVAHVDDLGLAQAASDAAHDPGHGRRPKAPQSAQPAEHVVGEQHVVAPRLPGPPRA